MTATEERSNPVGFGRMLRKEDVRFVRGKGNYVDDVVLPGMLHGAVLRSPFAHAGPNQVTILHLAIQVDLGRNRRHKFKHHRRQRRKIFIEQETTGNRSDFQHQQRLRFVSKTGTQGSVFRTPPQHLWRNWRPALSGF